MTQLIKLHAVMAKTTISRSHIYALIEKGEFPKQVPLADRSVAWVESEIEDWIDARIAARDGGTQS